MTAPADSEFRQRAIKNGVKEILIDDYIFKRRMHDNSLTHEPGTNLNSDYRTLVREKIKQRINAAIYWKPKTTQLNEISK